MKNPFEYGNVVAGDAFCNRKSELKDVLRAMENSDKLFIYSERRFGKTSLVRLALGKLPKKEFVSAYVDLWTTDGDASFAAVTAKALAEATATTGKKLLDTATTFFGSLAPRISLDNGGNPQLEFGVKRGGEASPELTEVLAAPAKIAEKSGRKAVVVFDEIQQILAYDSDAAERCLRSVIQHQQNVAYIFLGSRKHLIQRMFLDRSRPLYRSAGHYPLPPITEKDWQPFIMRRFRSAGKQITTEQVKSICGLTEGHPFYTQHLCHTLWELVDSGTEVRDQDIDRAVTILLDRESYAYATLWESLTKNEQRFLRGLANETEKARPFSADFTRRYGLRSASNAQRAVEGLLEKDLVDRDDGTFSIVDRFFRIWVRRVLS